MKVGTSDECWYYWCGHVPFLPPLVSIRGVGGSERKEGSLVLSVFGFWRFEYANKLTGLWAPSVCASLWRLETIPVKKNFLGTRTKYHSQLRPVTQICAGAAELLYLKGAKKGAHSAWALAIFTSVVYYYKSAFSTWAYTHVEDSYSILQSTVSCTSGSCQPGRNATQTLPPSWMLRAVNLSQTWHLRLDMHLVGTLNFNDH